MRAILLTCMMGVALGGCSSPTVIGEEYDGAGPGSLGAAGPEVGWVEPGERFFVTTYGSSSCPHAPTAISGAEDGIVVEMEQTGSNACTADLGPTSYALDLPGAVRDSRRISVALHFADDDQTVQRVLVR